MRKEKERLEKAMRVENYKKSKKVSCDLTKCLSVNDGDDLIAGGGGGEEERGRVSARAEQV